MLRCGGSAVAVVAVAIALLAVPVLPAQTAISADGVIESTSGGFKFPNGSVQTTAGGGTMRAPVPATGQQLCYDPSGDTADTIDCAGTGQDGEIQAGVAWPVPRFTDNLDGTVTDNLTGLIWLQNAGCTDVGSLPLGYVDAVNAANTLAQSLCGLADGSVAGDWRLPNIREILSLVDFSQPVENPLPLPTGHPFSDVVDPGGYNDAFWTSTTWKNSLTSVIQYSSGELSSGAKSNTQRFWAVRGGLSASEAAPDTGRSSSLEAAVGTVSLSTDGIIESTAGGFRFPDGTVQTAPLASLPAPVQDTGQVYCYSPDPAANGSEILCPGSGLDGEYQAGVAWPTPRFTDNGDGTVTDNLTGLIWLGNAYCEEIETSLTFAAALTEASTVADGICGLSDGSSPGDWRVPNINEYLSLIDFGHPTDDPSNGLPPGHPFPDFTGDDYWSSTTSVEDPTRAYAFGGFEGVIYDFEKGGAEPQEKPIWPVRGPSGLDPE